MPKISSNLFLFIYCMLGSIPILFGFFYIAHYGVNIAIWDQWDSIVPWTISYFDGSFQISWLFEQQNDSRAFFPSLIMLLVSIITNLNIKIIYFFGYVLYIIAFIIFFLEIKKDLKSIPLYLILLLPVIYYWFNPFHLARFIYNVGGLYYSFLIIMVFTTIFLLERSRNSNLYFFSSIITAVICSFSGAWGLAIWFSGFTQVLLQNRNDKIKKLIVWGICGGGIFYLYYFGLKFQQEAVGGASIYQSYGVTFLSYPLVKIFCFLGTVGSQIVSLSNLAIFFGFVLICILISLLINNRDTLIIDKTSKWYALIVLFIINSILLVLSRSGTIAATYFGPPDNMFWIPHFRHSPTIFFTIIGIYILTIIYLDYSLHQKVINNDKKVGNYSQLQDKKSINIFLLGMVFTLMILASLLHIIPGTEIGNGYKQQSIEAKYYLMNYENISEEVLTSIPNFFPGKDNIYKHVNLSDHVKNLKKYELNIFSVSEKDDYNGLKQFGGGIKIADMPLLSKDTLYNIDCINTIERPVQEEIIIINKTDTPYVTLSGWAIDSQHNSLAKAVFISLDDSIYVPAWYMRERTDVARYFNNSALKDSGFWASINIKEFTVGKHTLTLRIVSREGDGYYNSAPIDLNIII